MKRFFIGLHPSTCWSRVMLLYDILSRKNTIKCSSFGTTKTLLPLLFLKCVIFLSVGVWLIMQDRWPSSNTQPLEKTQMVKSYLTIKRNVISQSFVWRLNPFSVLNKVFIFLTLGNGPDWAQKLNSADYELLCQDGTRAPVSQWKRCHLVRIPFRAVVVNNDITPSVVFSMLKEGLVRLKRTYHSKHIFFNL